MTHEVYGLQWCSQPSFEMTCLSQLHHLQKSSWNSVQTPDFITSWCLLKTTYSCALVFHFPRQYLFLSSCLQPTVCYIYKIGHWQFSRKCPVQIMEQIDILQIAVTAQDLQTGRLSSTGTEYLVISLWKTEPATQLILKNLSEAPNFKFTMTLCRKQ